MASQNQNGFYSEPLQYNNYDAHASNGYPGSSRSVQPDVLAYQNAQAMGSLPQAFHEILTLSSNGNIGALEQRPTLGSVPTESQSGTGSDSDGVFVAFHRNMHHDDDVTMSGQQSQQKLDPESEVSESAKEEDDSSWEFGDGENQDDDVDGFNTTKANHLQTLQKSWIPWESYTELNQLFDEDGNRVEIVVRATTAKEYGEETVNGHRHHVMYRRNYFRVEAQYWLTTNGKKTGQLYVNLGGHMVPVEAVCATVRGAVEGDLLKEVEISTFNTARTKLSRGPLTLPLTPSNTEPVFEKSTAGDGSNELGTWLRMQWRKATENNGARRAKKSSTYNIVMRFMVRVRTRDSRRPQRGAGNSPGTELVKIGYCISGPIQARGRCPQSFEEYDPTNVDHKRRRPNNNKPDKSLLASKYDSKTRISKNKKQDTKKTRQSKRHTILPRTLTPSTGHTSFSRSLSPTATQTTVYPSFPRAQAPTAPMADFGAAHTEVDTVSGDEMGDFQRQVINEFGLAGENRYQHPAATPMWPSQLEAPPSDGILLDGIAAWAYPSESGHPDAISDRELNFDLH